jgi:hypothetical protein
MDRPGARLPTFVVIGAFRCGTTSLYGYLRQHPQVFLPLMKEPNYWAVDANPDPGAELLSRSVRTRAEYDRLYADVRPEQIAIGDISPEYLANPWAVGRIRANMPDARLVAILRNPVDRAWSDFLLHVRDGNEPLRDFAAALDAQADRVAAGEPSGHYLDSGRYGEQLRRYLEVFDREQLLVLLFEDLHRDTTQVLRSVFTHIGVDPGFVPVRLDAVNASGIPTNRAVATALRLRKYARPLVDRRLVERLRPGYERLVTRFLDKPTLDPALRARLVEEFRPDIELLQELIGRDLSGWTRV